MEQRARSIVKALTWRVLATATTALIVLGLTQDLELATKAGALDIVIKLILYYSHERGWGRVGWGTEVGNPRAFLDGFDNYSRRGGI